ncbi:MAG: proton-conducting transporter membrane subunit, partial [Bacteroidales bacterium]
MLRFEFVLCIILFVFLVMKLLDMDKRPNLFLYIANTFLLINFAVSFIPMESGTLFQGFFHTNDLVVLEKTLLSLGVLIISLQSGRWLMRHSEICIEFYLLMLSSLVGCFLMLSSGHILMLYIGIEMSTIPIAALSNFNKSERRSSEAGIKFILSSAFSSGIMLFGISMLYGAYGNLDFKNLQEVLTPNLLTIVAFSFMMGGFFFK